MYKKTVGIRAEMLSDLCKGIDRFWDEDVAKAVRIPVGLAFAA